MGIVVQQQSVRDTKSKRNSPCPCGATNDFGPIKFKRCCGKGVRSPRTASTPVIEFLRAVTYPFAWGEEKILCTNKANFISSYNRGQRRKLTNGDFADHFDGTHKIYFMGNPFAGAKCLAMIDIDVQKSKGIGSQEGALAFARKIDQLFSEWGLASLCQIHWEPSSTGIGLAGYFIVKGKSVDEARDTYDHLQELLKAEASGFDIEGVEVKGKPPSISYGEKNMVGEPQIENITFGSLAKYPTKATLEQLQRMPSVLCSEILSIPMPAVAPKAPTPKAKTDRPKVSPDPLNAGSYQPLKRQYLDKLPTFRKLAEWLLPRGDWQTSDNTRAIVTSEDLAIHLLILNYLTETEDDLAKPVKRIIAIWKALNEGGYTDRPFNCHRHKAIRGGLTVLGLIDWHDETYYRNGGKSAPGKCCQYSASNLCRELLAKFGTERLPSPPCIPLATELPALKNLRLIAPRRIENPLAGIRPMPLLILHADLEPILYEFERLAA